MTNRKQRKTYQIFDIKQLAEMEKRQKNLCFQAMASYKNWQADFKKQSDRMEIYYGEKEGIILRRHVKNTIRNYWRIRNDFRKAFRIYLKQNCVIQQY
jgi:hypothetical protein